MSSRQLEHNAPAYLRIAAELRRRVADGRYESGQPLPSQRQLSEEFGVTVMTLRQALERLKRERLVVTRQGLGTYVTPERFVYPVGPLRSLAQEMAAQGRTVTTQVLRCERCVAEVTAARALRLPPDGCALVLERLRLIEGLPSVYQRSLLPLDVWQTVAEESLEHASLYDLLEQRTGFAVERASERLVPAVLTERAARALDRAVGEPALLSERTTYAASDRPVLHDRAFIPGDRLVIAADRRRHDMSLSYELLDPAEHAPGWPLDHGGENA